MPLRNPTDVAGSWQSVTLASGWTNYGSPVANASYRQDSEKVIWLRGGVVSDGTNGTIFTLPSGYRPTSQKVFLVYATGSQSSGYILSPQRVDVTNTGLVTSAIDVIGYLSLDGIAFLVGS